MFQTLKRYSSYVIDKNYVFACGPIFPVFSSFSGKNLVSFDIYPLSQVIDSMLQPKNKSRQKV